MTGEELAAVIKRGEEMEYCECAGEFVCYRCRSLAAFAALQAERDALHQALKDARPLVAKWCTYQGNSPELHAKYLAPIDAALGVKKQ